MHAVGPPHRPLPAGVAVVAWLRLDDAMGEHRKTRRLFRKRGLDAFGLHAAALLHSARYLTDGFVDEEFVDETLDAANVRGKGRQAIIAALLECGQWEPGDAGWWIHDYLDHNPSKAEVEAKREAEREKKSKAGRKGAEARWGGSQSDGSHGSVPSPSHGMNGSDAIGADSPVPTRPVPSLAQVQGGQQ